jgi:sugar phosphate isomerase/epimerase
MALSENTLAVQSFCFRGFNDNAKVASLVKQIGLSAIELCGVHFDVNKPDSWNNVLKAYQDAGVEIVSVGVQMLGSDEAEARKHFEITKTFGASLMSVDFVLEQTPDCYRVAEKLAAEYNINLAIHNHGAKHWAGPARVLKHIFSQTDASIGLCMDTAWTLDSWDDPVQWVEQFADRLYAVHVKDFTFQPTREPKDTVIGTGNLDTTALANNLDKINFTGPLILEYEADVDDPAPALSKCVDVMKKFV